MNNTQARWLIIFSAMSISALVLFLLPSEIYAGNPREFISTRAVIVSNLLIAALILSIGLVLPILVPSVTWRRVYASLLGALFLTLWISGVFLVGDFGELDGTSFDLERHSRTLTIHSLVLSLAFIATCYCVWKWATYLIRVIAVIGVGLMIISVFNFYYSADTKIPEWEPANLEKLARFSTDQNLVIVVMDTFQSDVLQTIIDQDIHIRNSLDGFKFYPDTLGVAPSTYLTMPAFHSGKNYNNMMTLLEFYDLGVKENSFLVDLARNGYQVDLINPIAGTCPIGINSCKRQENLLLHAQQVTDSETSRLADLGIFRVAPGLLKQLVFDGSSGPITRLRNEINLSGLPLLVFQGNTVLELIADNISTDAGPSTAKLIHLFNTHPPYMFDSECQYIGVQKTQDRQHMIMQSQCAMHWFVHLLEQMKSSEVYDNSMIILAADTGAGGFHGSDDLSSAYAREHGTEAGEFGRLIGGANPVLAIKFPGERGALQTSMTQAQLTDIPRTVCGSLHACSKNEGINLGDDDSTERTRRYWHYRWKNEYWGLKYIPGIVQYTVTGPLWLRSSWHRELPTELRAAISTVTFSNEDPTEFFGMGWGHVEVNKEGISKRWSIAKQAELYLPLPVNQDLTLAFELMAAPGLSRQVMTVKVNGEIVDSRRLNGHLQFVTVVVPARLVTKPVSNVEFGFSELLVPANADRRKVAVSFFQLNIYRTPESEQR